MAEKEGGNKALKGIGGWLLFFVIWIGIGVVYSPIDMVSSYTSPLFDVNVVWILASVISWLLSLSVFILIFTKKIWVPKYIITIIWIQFFLSLKSLSGISFNPTLLAETMAVLIGIIIGLVFVLVLAIVWTLYFVKSQRVKNTFVK